LRRTLTEVEAEAVREFHAVPPVATIDSISSDKLCFLADMYEGWACSRGLDHLLVIRLLGWADGSRILPDALGVNYEPPNLAS